MRPLRVLVLSVMFSVIAPSLFAAATTFTVNSSGDQPDNPLEPPGDTACDTGAGVCTLRAAIQQATKTALAGSPYTVNFAIPGSPVITLTGDLPAVREQMTFNGFTQPGYTPGVVMVELNGNGVAAVGLDLQFRADNSIIQGLVIRNLTSDAIRLGVNGVLVQQCFIGTDVFGLADQGNGGHGIAVSGQSPPGAPNAIGGVIPGPLTLGGLGNVISGNAKDGINISAVTAIGTTVRNNFIGTNQLGTGAIKNDGNGITVTGSATGTNIGDANVISGNGGSGISLNGAQLTTVYANHIGTDITSAFAIPNGVDGVNVSGGGTNLIGGPTIAQRNVISGNTEDGVQLTGGGTGNHTVQGNFIGTNGLSTGALPNGRYGISMNSGTNIIVGTFIVLAQVVAGNAADGIFISGSGNNSISGNNIGEDEFGNPVPNGGTGISVVSSSVGNVISQNDIAFNGALGIDLSSSVTPDGVTPNDFQDPDTGGNNLQNYPVITSAVNNGGTVTVTGTLNSEPNSAPFPYVIDLYYNDAPDPSTFGEGQTFDSNTQSNTNANGDGTFTKVLSTNVPVGKWITATASGAFGTSEFSKAVMVTAPNADLMVTKTDSPDPVDAGADITYTVTLTNNGPNDAANVVLSDNIPINTTFVSLTPAGGYACSTPAAGGTGTITCSNATVLNGASDVFILVVKVDSGVSAGSTITNDATASSTTTDLVPGNNTGTATTAVTVSSDLSITKSDAPDPVDAGSNLTYTITATNNGPSDAAIVVISDAVPANTTFVSNTTPANFSCTSPAVGGTGTVTCTATAPLISGNSAVITMVVNVDPSTAAATTITNTATVSSPTDANNANDSATETTTVTVLADITITKTDSPDPVTAGNNVTYTITVTNNGPSDAAGVQITDPLPANTTFVSNLPSGNLTCTTPAVGANGTVTCTATGPIAPAGTATMTLVAKVDPSAANGSTVSNTATATATTPDPSTPNTATATTTVAANADLSATKTDTPDPVAPGSNITYTITITNNGPSDAQSVSVSDSTPANTTFVSVNAPGYACTSPAVGGTGAITCTMATMASAASTPITIVVNVNPATPNATVITNSVTATSATADATPGNNTGTATTTVNAVVLSADLSVTKTDSPDPVTAGTNLTYTIALSNAGPDPASTVTLTDALPAGTNFVSIANPVAYTCTTPAVGTNGTVTCTSASVPVGGPDTFTIVVSTDPASGNGSTISNTVTASSTTTDPDNTNNSATSTTTVATSADIALTKSDAPDPVTAGTNITYTITATNNGPSDAAGFTLIDFTPANTTFVSASGAPGFTCVGPAVGGTGAVTCSGANILTGTAPVFQIVVNVNAATPNATVITNTVTFTDTTADPNGANDTAVTTTTVTAAATSADLSITKSDAPDPVAAGANITYTIAVTNNGPNDATAVSLTDVIPFNTTFVSLSSPGGYSCTTPAVGGTGTVTCTIATLVNAAVSNFTLTVQVSAAAPNGTSILNNASIGSTTPDPAPVNNIAFATTLVTNVTLGADLSVTKSGTPNPVLPGANITYTVTVANAGPSAASNVIVSDGTPANTTFVSATMPAGYTCTTPAVGGTGNITCTNASLASGASGSFTFVVKVGAATANGTVITNSANVISLTSDPNATNNSATTTTNVSTAAANVPTASPLTLLLLAMTLAAAGWFVSRK